VLLADAAEVLAGVEDLDLEAGDLGVQCRQAGGVRCGPLAEQPGSVLQLRCELVGVGPPRGAVKREPLAREVPSVSAACSYAPRVCWSGRASSGSPGARPSTRYSRLAARPRLSATTYPSSWPSPMPRTCPVVTRALCFVDGGGVGVLDMASGEVSPVKRDRLPAVEVDDDDERWASSKRPTRSSRAASGPATRWARATPLRKQSSTATPIPMWQPRRRAARLTQRRCSTATACCTWWPPRMRRSVYAPCSRPWLGRGP